jgi:hypothetical protein
VNASRFVGLGDLDLGIGPDGKPGPLQTAHLGTSDRSRTLMLGPTMDCSLAASMPPIGSLIAVLITM